MMQFYLMNLAILRDLKIGRLNMLNIPEMNFLTFWGLSGVELDAKVNVPTGVKKFSLPVGRPNVQFHPLFCSDKSKRSDRWLFLN